MVRHRSGHRSATWNTILGKGNTRHGLEQARKPVAKKREGYANGVTDSPLSSLKVATSACGFPQCPCRLPRWADTPLSGFAIETGEDSRCRSWRTLTHRTRLRAGLTRMSVRCPGCMFSTWRRHDECQFRRRTNFMRWRSFLCLCFRIFLRRFLTTLAIHTPFVSPGAWRGSTSPPATPVHGYPY